MKIVVLDGYTNNPGDLSWADIESQGALTIHERTAPADVVSRCKDADAIFTNKVIVNAETLDQLPKLKYIGVLATGTNVVDLKHAASKDICVTNIPGYSTDSVAQHVLAFMLHFSSKIATHDSAVHKGNWVNSKDFCFTIGTLNELSGATIGIIGLGTIGRKIANIASAMGMKIVASHQSSMNRLELPYDVEWLPVDEVFKKADYLTLNCPLTPDTDKIVNADRLKTMKSSAVIINTGRGPLIDEQALSDALNAGTIAGAGLDVLSAEPPPADNPLLTAKNCVITPHIAWASFEARKRLLDIAAANLKAFASGSPENKVN
ncbi:MAG: D-2-hydroxyacid dehydrogenase [Lentisphaeraceae bacterium]|nr:D-2-hydroxyacid dehydrogenase [Lentisphaeraceae bacterium]